MFYACLAKHKNIIIYVYNTSLAFQDPRHLLRGDTRAPCKAFASRRQCVVVSVDGVVAAERELALCSRVGDDLVTPRHHLVTRRREERRSFSLGFGTTGRRLSPMGGPWGVIPQLIPANSPGESNVGDTAFAVDCVLYYFVCVCVRVAFYFVISCATVICKTRLLG